jgi:hypothetical protein
VGAVRGRGVLVGGRALGVSGRGLGVGGHDRRAVVDGSLVLVVGIALRVGCARLERHGGLEGKPGGKREGERGKRERGRGDVRLEQEEEEEMGETDSGAGGGGGGRGRGGAKRVQGAGAK